MNYDFIVNGATCSTLYVPKIYISTGNSERSFKHTVNIDRYLRRDINPVRADRFITVQNWFKDKLGENNFFITFIDGDEKYWAIKLDDIEYVTLFKLHFDIV